MDKKKMGRPTDNPKPIKMQLRLDEETNEKLSGCCKALGLNKSEVLRMGVHQIYDGLEKK
ncbi:CopG family transcriptional regulator [Clostridium sp. D33t1_170424_F3]|uniref:CopG family transcriptional regulator n=1 Tax=Clostridium sp. D33t1_170424_F3 TaxID=2787099 RepID=UPI0018A97FD4|nr:CopG family transcriptional regulator [Clostridium sp. D33t1_170424_F3]